VTLDPWAVPGVVFLSTVATCCWCLALGSYVAVFLALKALFHSALSLVSFALEDLSLPDEAFVYDLVRVFWLSKFDSNS